MKNDFHNQEPTDDQLSIRSLLHLDQYEIVEKRINRWPVGDFPVGYPSRQFILESEIKSPLILELIKNVGTQRLTNYLFIGGKNQVPFYLRYNKSLGVGSFHLYYEQNDGKPIRTPHYDIAIFLNFIKHD
jgi:hypothetical protein